jgi:release factor glutamine methyltransferase
MASPTTTQQSSPDGFEYNDEVEQVVFSGVELRTLPGLVMTPRPATEALVDRALAVIGDGPARVADVGTGSGAIAIALARRAPNAEIWATDNCSWSVLLAGVNIWEAGVDDRVHVLEGDLLAPVPGNLDLVLANLPYLPLADRALHPELDDEPAAAVYAEGDGLDPYRRLLHQAGSKLAPDGRVIFQLHRQAITVPRTELVSAAARLDRLVPAKLAA